MEAPAAQDTAPSVQPEHQVQAEDKTVAAPAESASAGAAVSAPPEAAKPKYAYGEGPGWVPVNRSSLIPKDVYLKMVAERDARTALASGSGADAGGGGGGGGGGSGSGAEHSNKRKRGQNKGRSAEEMGLGDASSNGPRLCRWAMPGATEPCPFGASCRDLHDMAAYLASKPADIEGLCPVFAALGVCRDGVCCRWAGSHTDPATGAQAGSAAEAAAPAAAGSSGRSELNVMPTEALKCLQRGRYTFTIPAPTPSAADAAAAADAPTPPTAVDATLPHARERKRLDFAGKIILAPLTTVGNLPFRRLLTRLGVDVSIGEMAMTSNLLTGQASEWALLKRHPSERCFGVQLAGNSPEDMASVCKVMVREGIETDFVDINCGCPLDSEFVCV